MSQAIYGFADKTSQDSRLCFSNDSAVVFLNGRISQIEPQRLPTCRNDFSFRPITCAPQWHYFPVCWSYPDFNINGLDKSEKTGVSGIQHVMLKRCRSEQDNAHTVRNMHCWGFTLFILFYSFKRYNAQFVFILIHTLHNVFIGRFSSPPTALGRTSIRPARHDHVWGFFEFSERSL